VVLEGHILDVNVEQVVPVLLDVVKVDGVAEDNGRLGVSVDLGHGPGDVSEVKVLHWINDISIDLNSAVVWVGHGVGVGLLNSDNEVIVSSLVPNRLWSEDKGLGVVVEEKEWWVLLVGHFAHEHLGDIVTLFILNFWELILVNVADVDSPGSLDLLNEVGVVVSDDFNVEIQLNELVQS